MHPHNLHAAIAAHNLADARHHLTQAVTWEAEQRRQDELVTASASAIQAWRPVVGRARGGHGDPVGGGAVYSPRQPMRAVLAELADRVDATLAWLDQHLGWRADVPMSELEPAAAREVWLWLAELDARIRRALLLPAGEELVPGVECPACRTRLVHAQVVAPGRPLVCRAPGCVCVGEGCACGMSVLVEGLVHVWDEDSLR